MSAPASNLSSAGRDRAAAVLLAQACGDALGAPNQFQSVPLPADHPDDRD